MRMLIATNNVSLVSTAVMAKTAVLSQRAIQCLVIPVAALTSTWRWLTYASVSILKAIVQCQYYDVEIFALAYC